MLVGGVVQGGGENIDVTNIHWLPPISALMEDQILKLDMCPDWGSYSLLVYGITLQPTEPHSQG